MVSFVTIMSVHLAALHCSFLSRPRSFICRLSVTYYFQVQLGAKISKMPYRRPDWHKRYHAVPFTTPDFLGYYEVSAYSAGGGGGCSTEVSGYDKMLCASLNTHSCNIQSQR